MINDCTTITDNTGALGESFCIGFSASGIFVWVLGWLYGSAGVPDSVRLLGFLCLVSVSYLGRLLSFCTVLLPAFWV